MRYSISPPLAAVIVIFASMTSWWVLWALVLPVALLVQAYITEQNSVERIIDALRYGIVESPTAETLIGLRHRDKPKAVPPGGRAKGGGG